MRFIIVVLVPFLLFSCLNNQTTYVKNIYSATIEDNTKTSVDQYGNVLWKKGDLVTIFEGNITNHQYQVTDESDGKTTATLNAVSENELSGTSINNNVAVYPYNSSIILNVDESSYVLSPITLPSVQSYVDKSFASGVFPMVAVTASTEDKTLTFKNVLGGVKLQLKGTASISSIKITGNNNEILCGTSSVTVSEGDIPSIVLSDASSKSVILDCSPGVQLNSETATSFIIALPPITMTRGFSVIVNDTKGCSMQIRTEKSVAIIRSAFLKMSEVTYKEDDSHPAIDLGLPSGILWSTMNLGASKPSDYGGYFAWTETSSKTNYIWSNLKYRVSGDSYSNVKFSKYVTISDYGTVDNKVEIETEDDAASMNWGKNWRTPTQEEWTELYKNCTWTWTTEDNHPGYRVTSKKSDNSIFLPSSGFRDGSTLYDEGRSGYYWSSVLDPMCPLYVWYCNFKSNYVDPNCGSIFRCYGLSIRPVTSK